MPAALGMPVSPRNLSAESSGPNLKWDDMPAAVRWIFVLALDAVLCGFFGLGIALLHFLWLEYAAVRWPRIRYTEDYLTSFALVCAAVVFVLTALRQIKTRLECKSLRAGEMGLILDFALIAMVGMTPVPGSNFPRYLYEMNRSAKPDEGQGSTGKNEEVNPFKLKRDAP